MLNSNLEVAINYIVVRDANEKLQELEIGDAKMAKTYSQYGEVNSAIAILSIGGNITENELKAVAGVFDKIYEMGFQKGYERGVEDTILNQMMEG